MIFCVIEISLGGPLPEKWRPPGIQEIPILEAVIVSFREFQVFLGRVSRFWEIPMYLFYIHLPGNETNSTLKVCLRQKERIDFSCMRSGCWTRRPRSSKSEACQRPPGIDLSDGKENEQNNAIDVNWKHTDSILPRIPSGMSESNIWDRFLLNFGDDVPFFFCGCSGCNILSLKLRVCHWKLLVGRWSFPFRTDYVQGLCWLGTP